MSLLPRQRHSKDLFFEIIDHLDNWFFRPDERSQLLVKLCPRGLEMSCKIDKRSLALTLYQLFRWNPRNPIHFVGKEVV